MYSMGWLEKEEGRERGRTGGGAGSGEIEVGEAEGR